MATNKPPQLVNTNLGFMMPESEADQIGKRPVKLRGSGTVKEDDELRNFGFKLKERKGKKEAIWEYRGKPYTHSQAIKYLDTLNSASVNQVPLEQQNKIVSWKNKNKK